MSFDAHTNFAYSTVATAPSPASSGTSLVVATGDGSKFPAAPFNATVWPASSQPTSSNAEIVRVTAKATDTFTIARTQESSSARSIGVGDQIAATITAKTLTDVEAVTIAKIFDTTLAVDTASFDTGAGGIPSGYGSLKVLMYLRTSEVATLSNINIRFNNDSGANYDFPLAGANAGSFSGGAQIGQTSWQLSVDGASAAASEFSVVNADIPNYDGTVGYKELNALVSRPQTTTTVSAVFAYGVQWRSTSAISRLSLVVNSGANFVAGSRVIIYGMP